VRVESRSPRVWSGPPGSLWLVSELFCISHLVLIFLPVSRRRVSGLLSLEEWRDRCPRVRNRGWRTSYRERWLWGSARRKEGVLRRGRRFRRQRGEPNWVVHRPGSLRRRFWQGRRRQRGIRGMCVIRPITSSPIIIHILLI
jgi:hypothetical protein